MCDAILEADYWYDRYAAHLGRVTVLLEQSLVGMEMSKRCAGAHAIAERRITLPGYRFIARNSSMISTE
jgi:hypothetical protein